MQSGLNTAIVQEIVKQKAMDHRKQSGNGAMTLLDYLSSYAKQRKLYSKDLWKLKIEQGAYSSSF